MHDYHPLENSIQPSLNKDHNYQEIGDKLWERFNVRDKSEHSWYYTGILNNIKQLGNTLEYEEFQQLVSEVFN